MCSRNMLLEQHNGTSTSSTSFSSNNCIILVSNSVTVFMLSTTTYAVSKSSSLFKSFSPRLYPQTPLILAARRGCLGSVKLLLFHGADLNYTLKQPIHDVKVWHIAKKAGHLHLEQYLRKCHGKQQEDVVMSVCLFVFP